MYQTPSAVNFWDGIPKDVRMKILNNVWCVECKKIRSVGNISMNVENGSLIINGSCTTCGCEVARLVEPADDRGLQQKSRKAKLSVPDSNLDISKIVSFRKGTKAAGFIDSVGKLKLEPFGYWDPNDEFKDYMGEELFHPYDKILNKGKRRTWALENILPGYDPDDFDCPIGVGIDMMNAGDWYGAVKHMKSLIKQDDRCIDAYAHLGNWYFEQDEPSDLNISKNYYKTGVAIGLKSIGSKSNDVFPWGLIENRPFFRCLHGLGLCLYRQKKTTEALMIFSKMIWLNPSDNQGARFLIEDITSGKAWEEIKDL